MGQKSKTKKIERLMELVSPEESGITRGEALKLAEGVTESKLTKLCEQAEKEFGGAQ